MYDHEATIDFNNLSIETLFTIAEYCRNARYPNYDVVQINDNVYTIKMYDKSPSFGGELSLVPDRLLFTQRYGQTTLVLPLQFDFNLGLLTNFLEQSAPHLYYFVDSQNIESFIGEIHINVSRNSMDKFKIMSFINNYSAKNEFITNILSLLYCCRKLYLGESIGERIYTNPKIQENVHITSDFMYRLEYLMTNNPEDILNKTIEILSNIQHCRNIPIFNEMFNDCRKILSRWSHIFKIFDTEVIYSLSYEEFKGNLDILLLVFLSHYSDYALDRLQREVM